MNKISILESQQVSTKYNNYSNQSTAGVTKTKSISTEDSYIKTQETLTPDFYTNNKTTAVQEKSSPVSEEEFLRYCAKIDHVDDNGTITETYTFPSTNISDEEKLAWISACKKLESEQGEEALHLFLVGIPIFMYDPNIIKENNPYTNQSFMDNLKDLLLMNKTALLANKNDFTPENYALMIKNANISIDIITGVINKLQK